MNGAYVFIYEIGMVFERISYGNLLPIDILDEYLSTYWTLIGKIVLEFIS